MRRLAALLILIACSAVSVRASAEALTVRLKWFNQAQFAGFYVAREKGFYQAEGLDVSIQPGGPDFPAVQMVAGGSEQFGVTGADQILVARGKGVPVVALAVLYRKNPFVLFSLRQSGIDSPEKFRGHKVGVKLGGNEELIYRAVLAHAKVSAQQLAEVPVKFDLTPLLSGQVDVWPGYVINEVITAREKSFDVNIIWPSDYGINLYADTLFTTEKLLKERPQVVQKFVQATLKGWAYAAAHPEEAARITVKSGDKLSYEHELAMMKASIPLLQPDAAPIGSMNATDWATLQNLLLQGGFLKSPLPLEQAYTTQFLGP
jgi:NitT/TauT family transport system substrate-binding protein